MHEDAPAAEYVPTTHSVHVNAPAGEYVPAAHCVITAPAQEEPAGHDLLPDPEPLVDVLPYGSIDPAGQ